MALIDLLADPTKFKYDSKTRQFGNDRPGGGDSGLPYIKFQMPGYGATQDQLNYYSTIKNSLDFPVRGGTVDFTATGGNYLPAGSIDRTRIKKFFEDKPRGSAFIQKQVGLQLSNPKIQTGQSIVGIGSLAELFTNPGAVGSLENTRVYNGGRNTLAQVLAAGTGTHLPRAGLLPIDSYSKYYMDVVGKESLLTNDQLMGINRLLILRDLKLRSNGQATIKNITTINKLGISLNQDQLFQYLGGPGSVYGIGSTIIRRATNTANAGNELSKNPVNLTAIAVNQTLQANVLPTVTDYDKIFNETRKPESKLSSNAHSTIYRGLNKGVDYKFYVSGSDRLNKTQVLTSTTQDPFTNEDPFVNAGDTKDIIKFGFECMSNDNYGFSTPLLFRAFLTNGITDSNSSKLNGFQYMGRGETFYTYGGFERSISFGFKIVAFSKDEMKPLYNKLNYLISQVYPDYGNNGVMRAPLVKVTVGDYLYRVPGFLESVNVTVDNASPWELNLDGDIAQLPKMLDVAISFKPIHDKLPRRSTDTNRMALIANNENIIQQNSAIDTTILAINRASQIFQ